MKGCNKGLRCPSREKFALASELTHIPAPGGGPPLGSLLGTGPSLGWSSLHPRYALHGNEASSSRSLNSYPAFRLRRPREGHVQRQRCILTALPPGVWPSSRKSSAASRRSTLSPSLPPHKAGTFGVGMRCQCVLLPHLPTGWALLLLARGLRIFRPPKPSLTASSYPTSAVQLNININAKTVHPIQHLRLRLSALNICRNPAKFLRTSPF